MKFKSILTGFAAFVAAGSLVYAYESELRAANAAYIDPNSSTNQCIAWDSQGCNKTDPDVCLEFVDDEGDNLEMYENNTLAVKGQPTECGDQLFRLNR